MKKQMSEYISVTQNMMKHQKISFTRILSTSKKNLSGSFLFIFTSESQYSFSIEKNTKIKFRTPKYKSYFRNWFSWILSHFLWTVYTPIWCCQKLFCFYPTLLPRPILLVVIVIFTFLSLIYEEAFFPLFSLMLRMPFFELDSLNSYLISHDSFRELYNQIRITQWDSP